MAHAERSNVEVLGSLLPRRHVRISLPGMLLHSYALCLAIAAFILLASSSLTVASLASRLLLLILDGLLLRRPLRLEPPLLWEVLDPCFAQSAVASFSASDPLLCCLSRYFTGCNRDLKILQK